MTRTLRFQGKQVDFPPVCVQCAQPAQQRYKIDRTFIYGRKAVLIETLVPLCEAHLQQARRISAGERLGARAGLAGSTLAGAGVFWALLRYWSSTGQGLFLLNVLIALPVALGFFLCLWVGSLFWIAPRFASPETKAARAAVRLSRYDPARDQLDLTFQNEQVAEWAARENAPRLADDAVNLREYQIRAALLCHDVRLNTHIEAVVRQAYPPDEEEAKKLLWPVGDAVVAKNFCEDCPYDLYGITVEPVIGF